MAQHYKEYKTPPDFFTAGGFSAAMAVGTALKKTERRHDDEQAHHRDGRHELRDAEGHD